MGKSSSKTSDVEVSPTPNGKFGKKGKRNREVDALKTSNKKKTNEKSLKEGKRNAKDDAKKSAKKQKTAAEEVLPVKTNVEVDTQISDRKSGKKCKKIDEDDIKISSKKQKTAAEDGVPLKYEKAKKQLPLKKAKKESSHEDGSSEESPGRSEEKDQAVSQTKSTKNEPKPHACSSQATESSFIVAKPNTVIVGNLSVSVDKAQLENFFQVAGDIVEIRLATFHDGSCKGLAQVEFATSKAVYKACELSGERLMDRAVTINFGHPRHIVSPDSSSFKKPEWFSSNAVLITGFDSAYDTLQMDQLARDHFRTCGLVTRVQIPVDDETGACKGAIFMEFSNRRAVSNAVKLDGSELGCFTLHVEDTSPRADNKKNGSVRGGRRGGVRGGQRGRVHGGRGGGVHGGRGGRVHGGRGGRVRAGRGGRGRGFGRGGRGSS